MDHFSFSGFSAANVMACVVDGTDIYQTDYAGNRQLIGKTVSAYTELEQTTTEYYNKLVELGVIVPPKSQEELMAAAEKMAADIAKNAPIAVRNCKKAVNEGLDMDMDEAIVLEEKLFGDCFETEDQKYGMAFFLDKNKEKVKEPFKNC